MESTNWVTFNWNHSWKDSILGNCSCPDVLSSQSPRRKNILSLGSVKHVLLVTFRTFKKHVGVLAISWEFLVYETPMQTCLQEKQKWHALTTKWLPLFLTVSRNAGILSLKVVILISLKNYAVNQMRTAGVRIRDGTISAVQTELSSKTAMHPTFCQ